MEQNQTITQTKALTKDQTRIVYYIGLLIAGVAVVALGVASLL